MIHIDMEFFDSMLDLYKKHQLGELILFPKRSVYWAIRYNENEVLGLDKELAFSVFYRNVKKLLELGSCKPVPFFYGDDNDLQQSERMA